jgi:hypothetical protein
VVAVGVAALHFLVIAAVVAGAGRLVVGIGAGVGVPLARHSVSS